MKTDFIQTELVLTKLATPASGNEVGVVVGATSTVGCDVVVTCHQQRIQTVTSLVSSALNQFGHLDVHCKLDKVLTISTDSNAAVLASPVVSLEHRD